MANHLLEKMFQREVQTKKARFEDTTAQVKDAKIMRDEAYEALERAKLAWEDKTRETDSKIKIREQKMK